MKHTDFLSIFLSNIARARLVRIFLFNQHDALSLSSVTTRAGVARGLVSREIKYLEGIKLIKSTTVTTKRAGKKRTSKKEKAWMLDASFQYLDALATFVHEVSPAQFELITSTLKKTGKVASIILTGSFVNDSSRPVDIVLAIDEINKKALEKALRSLLHKQGGHTLKSPCLKKTHTL